MISAFATSQVLVGIAALFDLVSFQFRSRRTILACLGTSSFLVASHFFILGNTTAGGCTLLTGVRFFVAYYYRARWCALAFIIASVLIFGFTYQSSINLLPLGGAVLGTVGSFHGSDKVLRVCTMVATLAWAVHNAIIGSPAAFALEVGFLLSNLVGFWRFYLRLLPKDLTRPEGEP